MQLRPYQSKNIADIRAQYAAGHRSVCNVLPTGAGKTVIAAWLIKAITERGRRVLFVAGRIELLRQTVNKLVAAGIEPSTIRMIQAQNVEGSADAVVTVASIDTLKTERWMRSPITADFLIIDECHHGMAATWEAFLSSYKNSLRLGLTATPERGDGKPLGDIFDSLVTGPTVADLTALGHLARCVVYPPAGGERLDPSQVALDPVSAYQRVGAGQRAVAFCVSRKHAAMVSAEFAAAGIESSVVDGTMAAGKRSDALKRFSAGTTRVICSIGVLTEGWDDPGCTVAILARGFSHPGLYLQCAGRILRPYPGKDRAILIDLVGSSLDHGSPDFEREYNLSGKAIASIKKDQIRQCKTCGAMLRVGQVCPNGCSQPDMPFSSPASTGEGLASVDGMIVPKSQRDYVVAMKSKRGGWCKKCSKQILAGELILWHTVSGVARHQLC